MVVLLFVCLLDKAIVTLEREVMLEKSRFLFEDLVPLKHEEARVRKYNEELREVEKESRMVLSFYFLSFIFLSVGFVRRSRKNQQMDQECEEEL